MNAIYVITGSKGITVREGLEGNSQEIMTLHPGKKNDDSNDNDISMNDNEHLPFRSLSTHGLELTHTNQNALTHTQTHTLSHSQTLSLCLSHTLSAHTGDDAHVFEEAFNMDGTLRLHLSRPVDGWISKLTGLITKISVEKQKSNGVSGELNEKEKELESLKEKDKNKEREGGGGEYEDEWSVLESTDDDLEQWGGSDAFRKEDRFFGTLQGSGYQVRTRSVD